MYLQNESKGTQPRPFAFHQYSARKRKSIQPYHATFANNPFGHLLTAYFLASSKNNIPKPNAAGKKKCSTGTWLVLSTFWKAGI
jgi:hypothetical protein